MNFIRKQDFMSSRSGLLRGACMPSPDPENASTLGFFTVWGGESSLVSILLFFIALLPVKSWAQSYTGQSGVVLTYSVSDDEVTITGMTTAPSDGKLVIPEQIEGKPVTTVGKKAFYMNKNITSTEIPASIVNIEEAAFSSCSNLTQVCFAENSKLTTIGYLAFRSNRNLTEITIPENVTDIDGNAFIGCTKIATITMLSKAPRLGIQWIMNMQSSLGTILVPAGSGEAYKTDDYWSDYADIIKEAAPTAITLPHAASSSTHAAIYTLDGRLVSKDGNTQSLAKGIYVQNGKKVVIGK